MLKTITRSLTTGDDAISLLEKDHRKVEALFKEFKDAKDKRSKLSIAKTFCMELAIHDKLESKVFYPAVKKVAKHAQEEINEGIVEHEAIRRLVKEIPGMQASDEFFETRCEVLMEYVKHHVKEEESAMFPKIVESKVDLVQLGDRLLAAKTSYQQQVNKSENRSSSKQSARRPASKYLESRAI